MVNLSQLYRSLLTKLNNLFIPMKNVHLKDSQCANISMYKVQKTGTNYILEALIDKRKIFFLHRIK